MKTLTFLRHAKSSWDDTSLEDFDRPLNKRGLRDAPRMGTAYAERGFALQRIISSEAVRARRTAELFAEAYAAHTDDESLALLHDSRLYLASPDTLFTVAAEQDDDLDHILIVAHNPGISTAATRLAGQNLDDSPTAFVLRASLDITSWADLPNALPGKPEWGCCPKNLPAE